MSELIWIGNTLLPRWFVFGSIIVTFLMVYFAFVWIFRS